MPNHCVAQSMVRMAVTFVACTWIAAGPAWGDEWKAAAEEDSKIVFYAPGLAGGEFFKRGDYNRTLHAARWHGYAGAPRAEVYLLMLAPDMLFYSDHDLVKLTGEWNFLKGKALKFAAKATAVNVVGRVQYLRFTTDGFHCVSFLQGWGSSAGWDNDRGVPPNFLTGYYCDRSALSVDTVKAVLGGIGVRGYKVPKNPVGSSGRFDGQWEGVMRCGSCENCLGPIKASVSIDVKNSKFDLIPDPSYKGVGVIDDAGNVSIVWRPDTYGWGNQMRKKFRFVGKHERESFVLSGERGPRSCDITLPRVKSPED